MGKVSEFGEGVDAPEECKELLGQIAKETEAAGKAMRKPAEEPPRVPLPGMAGYANSWKPLWRSRTYESYYNHRQHLSAHV